ncbi:HlyD family efflux transporter periplasmic adaptor subunit [Puteibacter caeruleilacunae]|nr:HlyD family efflux transporter periplasmic adaptor subunit [Puteibacter caeruleilacunae]
MKKNVHKTYKRSKTEEVQDIIDKMPRRTPRLVAIIVITLGSLLVFFGFLIRYPESVSGVVTIRAHQAPVRLTAMSAGRLHLLAKNKEALNSGELIAYIESSTSIDQFVRLDSLMRLDPIELKSKNILRSQNVALGELTIAYLKLVNCIESFRFYEKENSFTPKIEQLKIEKGSAAKAISFLDKQLALIQANKDISSKNLQKDSLQYFQLKSITETNYLQSKSGYLSIVQNINTMEREREQSRDLVQELKSRIQQLEVEQREYEQQLSANLYATYQELKNQMEQWKQKYAFVAPYSGSLEMLNFWKENAFIKAGEEIFAVMPTENPVNAQIIIASHGAGKVVAGQEVIIRLDDYPYLEYGSITGKVSGVSALTSPSDELSTQAKVNSYQVNVLLPEQLTTNYGTVLNFKHDIKGGAQILVKKRRLIERLFDNLKYIVNE